MHLSTEAKSLLDENRIAELQALPLARLLNPSVYAELISVSARPIAAMAVVGPFYSVARELTDSLSFGSLVDPVVISSGQIYSRGSIDELLSRAYREVAVCPNTREPIRRDCFGPEGAKQSVVRLPQIYAAVANFKQTLKIDRAIDALAVALTPLKLNLKVSRSKLRVEIEPQMGSNPEILKEFLQACFPDARSEIVMTAAQSRAGAGYYVDGYGRCWQANAAHARIDFWFPQDILLDDDVNEAMTVLLDPLALPASEIPPGSIFGSLRTLGQREYKDALPGMELPQADVAKCCKSFIEFSKNLVARRGQILNDVVTIGGVPTLSTHTGVMFFGQAPAIAATHSLAPFSSAAGPFSSIGPTQSTTRR